MIKHYQAKKSLGQNFLVDKQVVERLMSVCQFDAELDTVVEIGPGKGALTDYLIKQSKHLFLIEKDNDLADLLLTRYQASSHVKLFNTDALKFDYSELSKNNIKLRLIGNLPYNISTPLLFHLLTFNMLIKDMHFMLQKEVVDRMVAKPGNKTYGRLSVMIQYACQAHSLFLIPPTAFKPVPKVISAYVKLIPKQDLPLTKEQYTFFELIVRTAFNARRKQIKNTLKQWFNQEQFEQAKIDSNARPETLGWEDFVRLVFTI